MENLEEKNEIQGEIENYGEGEDKRREIIHKFKESFQDKDIQVRGSFAKGEEDEYSDIDLSVSIEPAEKNETIEKFENFLSQFGEINKRIEVKRKFGPKQIIYHIKGMPKYRTIDFVINYPEGDLITERAEKDEKVTEEKIEENIEYLRAMFEHSSMLVEKEAKRGDFLYASRLYIQYIFDSVINLARGRYTPDKAENGTRNLKKDLEENGFGSLFEEIENLWLVDSSKEEIGRKLESAKLLYEAS